MAKPLEQATAITGLLECLHPLGARGRYTGGSLDQPWDTCAACGSVRLVHDGDCRCGSCRADLDQPWEPAVLARMVPGFLAVAGLGDASEEDAEAYLDARLKAWELATAGAGVPGGE